MMNKLVLGSVQFGIKYGINHKTQPTPDEVIHIIQSAIKNQIDEIDTAEVYGNALEILSGVPDVQANNIKIVTKVTLDNQSFYRQLHSNLKRLQLEQIKGCYLHRFKDLYHENLINDVARAKDENLIQTFGVSIYSLEELKQAINISNIDIIQIPFNFFDQAEEKVNLLKEAKLNAKSIYARSVFLQGLFFMSPKQLPPNLIPLSLKLKMLQELSKKFKTPLGSLCLKYVLDQDYIDKVIIGVENVEQLNNNLKSLETDIPYELLVKLKSLNVDELDLINPALWKK